MKKKRILIFIDWYLPGYKAGGPIQSVANLVAHLKDEFEFSIITRDTDYCETTPYKTIKSNEWNVIDDGSRIYYFSTDKLTRSNLKELIRKEDFDAIYLNGIYSLYFTLYPLLFLRKKKGVKIIIAARGMFSEGSLGVKKTKKQFFIRAVKVLRLFDRVLFHATTEMEKHEIQQALGEKSEIMVAANLPQKVINLNLPKRTKTTPLRLVNIARIAPEKNLAFALKILKNVKEEIGFDFYGPVYDQQYWNECKSIMDELPQNVTANYKGSIESTKVNEILQHYHFMFMPTTGENFGHIILQSLSAGLPVIISDQTPWKNLHEKNVGWDLPLNNSGQFSEVLDAFARMSQEEYNQTSAAAFQFAQNYVQNPEIIRQNRLLFA